jgi:hypothetical protein
VNSGEEEEDVVVEDGEEMEEVEEVEVHCLLVPALELVTLGRGEATLGSGVAERR